MNRAGILLFGVFVGFSAFFAGKSSSDGSSSRQFGPVYCQQCLISSPLPDSQTHNALVDLWNKNGMLPGDKAMICNDNYCSNYTLNIDGNFQGNGRVEQQGPVGGEGGAPGSGGPAGGSSPVGGSGGIWRCGDVGVGGMTSTHCYPV